MTLVLLEDVTTALHWQELLLFLLSGQHITSTVQIQTPWHTLLDHSWISCHPAVIQSSSETDVTSDDGSEERTSHLSQNVSPLFLCPHIFSWHFVLVPRLRHECKTQVKETRRHFKELRIIQCVCTLLPPTSGNQPCHIDPFSLSYQLTLSTVQLLLSSASSWSFSRDDWLSGSS